MSKNLTPHLETLQYATNYSYILHTENSNYLLLIRIY